MRAQAGGEKLSEDSRSWAWDSIIPSETGNDEERGRKKLLQKKKKHVFG